MLFAKHLFLERVTGIEPVFSAWEADIMPLYDTRIFLCYNYKVNKKKSQKLFFCFFIFSLSALLPGGLIRAAETGNINNNVFLLNLDKNTVGKGYEISAFAGAVELILPAGSLKEESPVAVKKIDEEMVTPWQIDRASPIFQFEIINKTTYDNGKPISIQIKYDSTSNSLKQIFYYDKTNNYWRPLPTDDFPGKSFARASIHLPFARVAVFDNPRVLAVGKASWYKFKSGNFAASPDFPRGAKIRVYNTDNDKFVDVEINDYGPERNLHPDRVIDLEKRAFAKIASLKKGIINVKIKPLHIPPEREKNLASGYPARFEPIVSAKSAIVKNERTGEIIFAKEKDKILPLASLTKLVAGKVFLDTRPSLDKTIAYSISDEEHNYRYVDNKWESARLKIKDGETLTVGDLLYSALIGSANNAVETLVRASGLPREKFIEKMNETTAGWGAVSAYFVEPTGLSPQNVSSASDYAIITQEVFKHPIIQKASAMKEYKFSTLNTKKAHKIKNTNNLLSNARFRIIGSKTGYLDEAGYCLMIKGKTANDDNIIVITMGAATKAASFAEAADLLEYGLKKYD